MFNDPLDMASANAFIWKYIIRDFYRVEFESYDYDYHYIPVLEATLIRFTTLVRGHTPSKACRPMRTRTAAQGRNPKIKRPAELSAPMFTEDDKGKLKMSDNLGLVAEAIGLAERLA